MAHLSPAVYLIWALLTTMLGSFLVFHLWSFDRFKCLRWDHGPYSGAFKRVMTYSYLMSIPFIITYAVGFSIIKYTYGFTVVPTVGVMPTPYELWSPSAQRVIFPLYLSLSISWGLEMVTHLEELCFWLFLVNAGSVHQDWFRSLYFKIWAVGSCLAVLAMLLITTFTRHDVLKCEAFTFLAGGLASLSLTIWFLPVLWTFPSFIANLNGLGIETATLVRLTKYHELNCIRVVFRFLFTIPLVILAVDGVRPHQHINDKMFPTDLLGIVAGIGCVVSSGITLVIFFPRSIEGEITQKEEQRTRRRQRAQHVFARWHQRHGSPTSSEVQSCMSITQPSKAELDDDYDPFAASLGTHHNASVSAAGLPSYEVAAARQAEHGRAPSLSLKMPLDDKLAVSISLQPNRRMVSGDIELGGVLSNSEVELVRVRSTRDRGQWHAVNARGTCGLHDWKLPTRLWNLSRKSTSYKAGLGTNKCTRSLTLESPLHFLHPSTSTLSERSAKSIMFSSKERFKPDPDDFIIVFMGPTGSGKTNFINNLTGNTERRKAGHLKSDTQDVTPYLNSYRGVRVVLVEMPGFDDTYRQDSDILRVIADWLTKKYPDGTTLKIAGIIYTHRITNNRMSGTAYKNLQMFGRLCGDTPLPRTSLVMTMWDQRVLIAGGAKPEKFYNTPESAQNVIDHFIKMGNDGEELLLQEELVKQQKRLNETEAGKLLFNRLQKLLADQRKMLKELAEEAKLQNNPSLAKSLQEEYDKIDAQLKKTLEEIKEMKIPFSRRILLWLFERKSHARGVGDLTRMLLDSRARYIQGGPGAVDNSDKNIASRERFRSNPEDFVIVIMGSTGSGKTNFINKLTGNAEQLSACGLQSDTQDVIPSHISCAGHRIVLVDTPGIGDTRRQDNEILRVIAKWLTQNYPDGTTLKIAVYLHRITDDRMSGSALESLQMFGLLCGDIPLRRTLLVTTMWDQEDPDVAAQRETELTSDFWQKLIKGGTTAYRFHNTPASARNIIDDILNGVSA
ncbi:hypothetical protein OG21DRAFT_1481907 [Imleria badia]|nr:hypothetical protein OG21DRAFT_1481907 [Imleria badia]